MRRSHPFIEVLHQHVEEFDTAGGGVQPVEEGCHFGGADGLEDFDCEGCVGVLVGVVLALCLAEQGRVGA